MNHSEKLPRFLGIENLRAIAIIMVMLYHYARWFEHPAWFPGLFLFFWTGVDLFFVISGFLISSQLFIQIKAKGGFSLKEFYIKRFFRIVPLYFFVVAIYFLFPFYSADFGFGQTLPKLWKFLTFTQNLRADYGHHRSFVSAWSLCVEEHFYLLFPVIVLFFLKIGWFKKGYILIPMLVLAGIIIRGYVWSEISALKFIYHDFEALYAQTIYMPTYCRLDGLLAGVAIGAFYVFSKDFFIKVIAYGNLIIGFGILIFIIAFSQYNVEYNLIETVFGFPLISLGFGCMVLGAIMPGAFLYNWKSKILSKIGEWSYSLYLTHMMVILSSQVVFSPLGIAKNSISMFVISIVCCFLIAIVSYYGLEKPMMKWRKMFLK